MLFAKKNNFNLIYKNKYYNLSKLIITYWDFFNKVNENDLVLFYVDNDLESIAFYIIALEKNIKMILIDKGLKNDTVYEIIKKYCPNWVFSSAFLSEVGGLFYRTNERYLFKIQIANEVNLTTSNTLLLLSTSGSTGSQKFVKISYDNLIENANSIKSCLDIKKTDVTITNLPLQYSFGLSILNSHLLAGATIVLTNHSVIQKEFWDEMKEYKVTSLYGVPYTFEMLNRMRFFKMQLPHLKLLAQAGGKMPIELQRKFIEYSEENNIKYFTMYGQTEATARMSYVPYDKASKKLGSIGVPIPKGRFELRDSEKQIINNQDEVGELVYYGPNVSLGYATNYEDLLKEDENKGVLYTGDLAKRDEDGYYYIVGRKNRFLKLFGNRISLQEIEELLESRGIEAVCGGQDDKLITYTTNEDEVEQIRKWLSEFTKIHFSAFDVKFVEKIPRNETGKILYTKLFS